MAVQKIATPHGGGKSRGGELTVTLRSVEVGPKNMTVRWALRWDDPKSAADTGVSYYDMGVVPTTTVTDRDALKAYKPYCTDGAWQPEAPDGGKSAGGGSVAAQQIRCERSMLVSPLEAVTFSFPNHGTVEAWAVLPAPEGRPTALDVAPAEGLPLFTGAEVTYVGGDAK